MFYVAPEWFGASKEVKGHRGQHSNCSRHGAVEVLSVYQRSRPVAAGKGRRSAGRTAGPVPKGSGWLCLRHAELTLSPGGPGLRRKAKLDR